MEQPRVGNPYSLKGEGKGAVLATGTQVLEGVFQAEVGPYSSLACAWGTEHV